MRTGTSKLSVQSGQATVESTIGIVALVFFLLMVLGAFNDMYMKLVTNFEGYELAFCASYNADRECERKTQKKLQSLLHPGADVRVETGGSLETKTGKIKIKGILKNEVESERYFLIPRIKL